MMWSLQVNLKTCLFKLHQHLHSQHQTVSSLYAIAQYLLPVVSAW